MIKISCKMPCVVTDLIEGGVCEHVVMGEAEARGDDRGGRCDGGDGRRRAVGQQDVPLRTVQRNLLRGLYSKTNRDSERVE